MKVKRAAFLAAATIAVCGGIVFATATCALPYLIWREVVADVNIAFMVLLTGLLVMIFGAIAAGSLHGS